MQTMVDGRARMLDENAYYLARNVVGAALNVFAIKMAGVFIISTSTIIIRTGILPRWVAYSGYACAVVLLLIITSWRWIALLFPMWMLLVSTFILIADFRAAEPKITAQAGQT
jgi:hypothetical protein